MKKSRLLGAMCAGLIVSGVFNTVQAATWGAEVGISTISPCPSYCGGVGGIFGSSSDGGEFSASAFTSLSNADGTGQTSANLSGSSLLPVLGAEGFSGSNSRIDSWAVGMLGYTYMGATSTTISLDIALDGERGGTTNPFDAWVNSNVAVILGDVNDFFTHYETFIFEVVPGTPGLSELGTSNLSLDLNVGLQTKTGSIGFTLNPGDEFFVWAGLNAGGIRDGFGDAFNTLSMSYSDDTGISPSVVPVPAAFWLFGSGLLGLIGIARRKRA
ncbi:VPLPA-CTERM sorting domain-containing protein [Crocinitomicaceae bacterium]|nr:VPLPA-CTERM sorting domain-containing protein [Crocinitomicaceae bacterium]